MTGGAGVRRISNAKNRQKGCVGWWAGRNSPLRAKEAAQKKGPRADLADNAALHARARLFFLYNFPTAPPPVVLAVTGAMPGWHAVPHEHARARRGLEDVVDALDLERGALLVRARADRLRDLLGLLARHKAVRVRRARRRPQVRLAPDEDDRYLRPADRAHLFDPLRGTSAWGWRAAGARARAQGTHLHRDVVQRVGRVDGECDEDDM